MEFELTPPSSGTLAVLGLIATLLVVTATLLVWITWSASHSSISIRDRSLKIDIPVYGRTIPIANLDLAGAQVLSLDESSDVRTVMRTNGIGLPGYAAGWFKLASGRKALLGVTSGPVLYIPTSEGYSILLSLKHPDVALQKLRSVAGA